MKRWIGTTLAIAVVLASLPPASTIGATEVANAELVPTTSHSLATPGAPRLPEVTFARTSKAASFTLSLSSRPASAANPSAPCSEDTEKEAKKKIRERCGEAGGWALLWCDQNGGTDWDDAWISCGEPPDSIVVEGPS